MGKIQLMSTSLANQIAAGEVVVRPASCVKELVENSLDAGAKRISVTLTEGGIAGILVQDDGVGMDEADAQLAFARHASSKVYEERDLTRIRTLGFRGEALASIAAVARVTLTTRQAGADAALEIKVAGGEMAPIRHVGAAVGTSIEVRDLFYNTPARLKYLRSVQTEQAKSVEIVQRAALSRPDVAFSCQTEHHVLFQTPGNGDMRTVLASLYGVGEAKQLLAVTGETNDYVVKGYIGRPTQGRASRSHAHLFVNGRPVRNIAVHQAVIRGYKNRLMVGKQPMYAIYIEMDPSLIDVNVHPHKEEVRFSEEGDVTRFVAEAIAAALDETLLAPTPVSPRVQARSEVQPLAIDWSQAKTVDKGGQRTQESVTARPAVQRTTPFKPQSGVELQDKAKYASGTAREADVAYAPTQNESRQDMAAAQQAVTAEQTPSASAPDAPQARKANWQLRPIGQALGMYVLADDGETLYIIDQHAAHERILFEQFYKRLTTRTVYAMPLLAPITLTLTPSVFERTMSQQAALSELGLTFEHFGGYDVVVRTVPDIWEGLDMDKLVHETFEQLPAQMQSADFHQLMHDVIATRACKAAVKANWHLSEEELAALCHALTALDDPFHCPHGRPIFLQFTDKHLEKEFRRIV